MNTKLSFRRRVPDVRRGLILFAVMIISALSACAPASHQRVVVCGMSERGVILLGAEVTRKADSIVIGELGEFMTLPAGASCPHQWQRTNFAPVNSRILDGKRGWFVIGTEDELGGTVFRLNWQNTQVEMWFQLPRGDFVLDVIWSETQGWQALTVGGNPDCGDIPLGNEYNRIRCAQRSGALYLVDNSGYYRELREASGRGRCYGVFNPQADAVAFVESEECFAYDDASSRTVVLNLDSGQSWVLSGDNEGGKPYWSPDGEEVVFEVASGVVTAKLIPPGYALAGAIGEIRVVDVESKQVRVLWPTSGSSSADYCGIATSPQVWSYDGQHLALACYAGLGYTQARSLNILNVNEDNMFSVCSIAPDDPYFLSWYPVDWSPDGNWVEWLSSYRPDGGQEFYFQNLQNNESRNLLVPSSDDLLWLRWSLDGNTLGAIRTTGEQGYLDLYSWGDFNVTATVELPQGVNWSDLYWISE